MAKSQNKDEWASKESRYELLLKKLESWPEWKIQTLCLDESDLVIRNKILSMKQKHNCS